MVPLSRTLQVKKDFAKLRSWARAGFSSCGKGRTQANQVEKQMLSTGWGRGGGRRGIQGGMEGEMMEGEREPGPVPRAPDAMLTTCRLPLQDTAGTNGM